MPSFSPSTPFTTTTITTIALCNAFYPKTLQLSSRNMVIGLAFALYQAVYILPIITALSAPALPDVSKCYPTDGSGVGPPGKLCCPPVKIENIVDFDPTKYPNHSMRVRLPAHKVGSDPQYVNKLKEAIRRMKALPVTDPRNFYNQAKVHCAFCNGCYRQVGFPNHDFLVHRSWLFLPFHRAYIYFIERILGKLIDDPTFALPFWNWDHPDGMRIPEMYTGNSSNPLFDPFRDPVHQPPKMMDLNHGGSINRSLSDWEQIQENLFHMKVAMVRNKGSELFMGGPFIAGDYPPTSLGAFERVPHNTVHIWMGNPTLEFHKDMGNFFTAAQDPIFYSHHANVDRLWSIWKTLNPKNRDFPDPSWLNSYFVLFDENAQPVRIYIRDCLNTDRLGYTYPKDVPLPWLNFTWPIPRPIHDKLAKGSRMPAVSLPKALDSVIRTSVARSTIGRSKSDKENKEEVLVVEVELVIDHDYVLFDVYINIDEEFMEEATERVATEFAGTFVELPKKPKHDPNSNNVGMRIVKKSVLRLALTDLIDEIGADENDYLEVVLVPRVGKEAVVIKDVKIEFVAL